MPTLDELINQYSGNNQVSHNSGGDALDNLIARYNPESRPGVEPGLSPDDDESLLAKGIKYLGKPAGALAGAAQYGLGVSDAPDVIEAAKAGWDNNTSNTETIQKLNPEFAKEHPVLTNVIGTGLDIAADPLWVATPAKALNIASKGAKVVGLSEIASEALKATRKTELGQKAVQSLDNLAHKEVGGLSLKRWFQEESPIQSEIDSLQLTQQNSAERIREGVKLLDDVNKANPKAGEFVQQYIEAQPDIGKFIKPAEELADRGISEMKRSEVLNIAKKSGLDEDTVSKIFNTGEKLATMSAEDTAGLLERGLISPETAAKFEGGRHIRREYSKYVSPEEHLAMLKETGQLEEAAKFEKGLDVIQRGSSKYKLDLKQISQRQDLPPEVQVQLGRLMDATHPFAKGGKVSADLIAKYDFLKSVADNYASNEAKAGYSLLEGKQFGPLNGKHVPREVYNEINLITRQLSDPESWWRKSVAYWKLGKTVLNPATFMRNNISNVILLNLAGMPLHEIPEAVYKAAKEFRNPGELMAEAKKVSPFLSNNLTNQELDKFLSKIENPSLIGQGINKIKGGVQWAADKYQGSEKVGKLAAYIWAKGKGMTPEQAAKFADEALFNYSKVPPIIDYMRKNGIVPFATFPYKATKMVTRELYENPANVGKYYKPIANAQDEDEQKLIPEYLRPQTLLPVDGMLKAVGIDRTTRIVDGKPQKVRNYLDMQYIYPFESGASVGLSPAVDLITALNGNKDSLGRDIVRKGMTPEEQWKARGEYIWKTLTPSMFPGNYSWDKLSDATKAALGMGSKVDSKGRQYELPEAIAQTMLGLKNVPINLEEIYRQRQLAVKNEIDAIRAEQKRVSQDRSLSKAEKAERLKEYYNNLQHLQQEGKEMNEAYKQLKLKEGRN